MADIDEICTLRTEVASVPVFEDTLGNVLQFVQALEHHRALKKCPIAMSSQCVMSGPYDKDHDGQHEQIVATGINTGHNAIAVRTKRAVLLVSHGSGHNDQGDLLVLLVFHHAVAVIPCLAAVFFDALPHGLRCHEEAPT